MPDITDLTAYNLSMKKSLIDKMFFMDKIDDNIKVIMDYGCADGALIRFLAPLFPEIVFVGYDKSEDMIERAITETMDDNCYFTANLSVFQDWLGDKGWTADQCIINLSLSTKYIVMRKKMRSRNFGSSSMNTVSNTLLSAIWDWMKPRIALLSKKT